MSLLLLAMITAADAPSALDAYRANLNSVRVEAEIEYTYAFFDGSFVGKLFDRPQAGVNPIATPACLVEGAWAHDGRVQFFRLPDQVRARELRAKTSPSYQFLFDHESLADVQDEQAVKVELRRTNQNFLSMFGPYALWQHDLDTLIATDFPGIKARFENKIWGREAYPSVSYTVDVSGGGRNTMEVFFDPAWNFAYRYARITCWDAGVKKTFVKDHLVVDVKKCSTGGVYPVEWYERAYTVPFSPSSRPTDEIPAPQGRVQLGYLRVKDLRDQLGSTRLKLGDGKLLLAGFGGQVELKNRQPTLEDLIKTLGGKINPSEKSLKKLKAANTSEATPPTATPRTNAKYGLLAAGMFCFVALFARKRLTSRATIPLLLLWSLPGCTEVADDSPAQVAVSFVDKEIFCRGGDKQLEDRLAVSNQSTSRLRVFGIDGGCSCRSIDKAVFPLLLAPGGVKGDRVKGDILLFRVLLM